MQYLMQLSRGALHLTPSQRMCKYELNFQFQYNYKICNTVLTNNNACEMLSVSSLVFKQYVHLPNSQHDPMLQLKDYRNSNNNNKNRSHTSHFSFHFVIPTAMNL